MKYIRTKDGIYVFEDFSKTRGERCLNHYGYENNKHGICVLGTLSDWKTYKKADTIEELCDEFVLLHEDKTFSCQGDFDICKKYYEKGFYLYAAIWTDKGLKYVAKMNEKGELELL